MACERTGVLLRFPGMCGRRGLPVSAAWKDALDGWWCCLRSAGRAETTIGTRLENIRRFARHAGCPDPWTVTTRDLEEWLGRQAWSTESRRGFRNSLVAFYDWGVCAGHMTASPAADLTPVKATPPAPRPTPDDVYRAALASADGRTRLILRLAAEVGLRRSEISHIHSDDLIQEVGGWSLVVHGKGGKDRVVPLPHDLAHVIRIAGGGYLFPGNDDGHLSPRYVGKLATRVLHGKWTIHSLRHRFASRAYALDRDLFTVQDLLGHASPATTRVYVQVLDADKRRTVQQLADVDYGAAG